MRCEGYKSSRIYFFSPTDMALIARQTDLGAALASLVCVHAKDGKIRIELTPKAPCEKYNKIELFELPVRADR